jgi:hypothetical protein
MKRLYTLKARSVPRLISPSNTSFPEIAQARPRHVVVRDIVQK